MVYLSLNHSNTLKASYTVGCKEGISFRSSETPSGPEVMTYKDLGSIIPCSDLTSPVVLKRFPCSDTNFALKVKILNFFELWPRLKGPGISFSIYLSSMEEVVAKERPAFL